MNGLKCLDGGLLSGLKCSDGGLLSGLKCSDGGLLSGLKCSNAIADRAMTDTIQETVTVDLLFCSHTISTKEKIV
jgi:hypothetical protein